MPAEESLAAAVTITKGALDASDVDAAAVRLAERIAAEIDDGGSLERLSPRLLAVLVELRATPRSRLNSSRAAPTSPEAPPSDALSRLREARQGPA